MSALLGRLIAENLAGVKIDGGYQFRSNENAALAALDVFAQFDPRVGDHLWIVATMYRVVPEEWGDGTHTPMLDRENLLSITVPCCYFCEQAYSARLASRRCRGTLSLRLGLGPR